MRGFSQKSNNLKRLTGDRPLNNPTPEKVFRLPCPKWIHGHGRNLWRSQAPSLIEAGVLTRWDVPAFQALCVSYGLMMQAAQELTEEGLKVPAERGGSSKKHPAHTVFRANSETFRKFAELFGLAPLARQRLDIKVIDTKEKSFLELLDNGYK